MNGATVHENGRPSQAQRAEGAMRSALGRERDTGRTTSEESTTPDLAELVNRWGEAANRRDFDAVESFYAPDAVLRGAELVGTFEGAAAIQWSL